VPSQLSSKNFAGFSGSEHVAEGADLRGVNILVVDDNKSSRMLISHLLRTGGFTNIDLAADGHEALRAIAARIPDLIMTDLLMPNLDGFELCSVLRADPRTRDTPILVQTASTDPDLRAQAFEAGATDLLSKPFDVRELLARARIILERGQLIERLSEFQRRVATELRQAATIQDTLLPNDAALEHLQAVTPLRFAGHYEASAELSGDLWGVEQIRDQAVLVFTADFVGHGLGAALNTVRLHSFLSSTSEKSPIPSVMLAEANQFLCQVLPVGHFATMFCALVDCRRRTIDFASAGAPPQLLRCAANRPFEVIEEAGFPLGITREATYETRTAPFSPGGTVLMFSDALIETPAPPNSAFTPESLRGFLNQLAPTATPIEMRARILEELFSRSRVKPHDDLSLVAVQYAMPE
jgi:phosphoserine phosphatase RsbU/P